MADTTECEKESGGGHEGLNYLHPVSIRYRLMSPEDGSFCVSGSPLASYHLFIFFRMNLCKHGSGKERSLWSLPLLFNR